MLRSVELQNFQVTKQQTEPSQAEPSNSSVISLEDVCSELKVSPDMSGIVLSLSNTNSSLAVILQ